MTLRNTVNVMGYEVYSGDLFGVGFYDEKCVVNTINAHSYCVARNDEMFSEALKNSSVLLADGSGITLAASFLSGNHVSRITGMDIFSYLMDDLNQHGGRCFFLGSTEYVLDSIESNVLVQYPNVLFDVLSPPFKSEFDEFDNKKIIEVINDFSPDVLFVGMTAPKQEKWVYSNYKSINASVFCSIGAVFDFYSGNKKRAPLLVRRLGFEWLYRSLLEPSRMGVRNIVSIPKFLIYMFVAKVSGFKSNK